MMDTKKFIGRRVKVLVDRPLGSTDPTFGYTYPVNCGHVLEESDCSSSNLDVYVLGLCDPINAFEGDCIAVIHSEDATQNKLVIVPAGAMLSDEAIIEGVQFKERHNQPQVVR
ncbi:inorganic pyrophosphatase [Planctomycetota bacterium]|nr:inorganic pyrophosphatase [Planctomycetota bacterium]